MHGCLPGAWLADLLNDGHVWVCMSRLVDKKNLRRYDNCLRYTLVSSKKALKQAGLDREV